MKNIRFNDTDCYVMLSEYNSGRTCLKIVEIVSGSELLEPTLSIDEIEDYELSDEEFLVIVYFEGQEIVQVLESEGVLERTGRTFELGNGKIYEVCVLWTNKSEKMKEIKLNFETKIPSAYINFWDNFNFDLYLRIIKISK